MGAGMQAILEKTFVSTSASDVWGAWLVSIVSVLVQAQCLRREKRPASNVQPTLGWGAETEINGERRVSYRERRLAAWRAHPLRAPRACHGQVRVHHVLREHPV